MKIEHKNRLKALLKECLGREPKPSEVSNSETDVILRMKLLEERVEALEKFLIL